MLLFIMSIEAADLLFHWIDVYIRNHLYHKIILKLSTPIQKILISNFWFNNTKFKNIILNQHLLSHFLHPPTKIFCWNPCNNFVADRQIDKQTRLGTEAPSRSLKTNSHITFFPFCFAFINYWLSFTQCTVCRPFKNNSCML